MRLGYVEYKNRYLVDLDNPDMVLHAKESIWEDISYLTKEADTDSFDTAVDFIPAPEAVEGDIPSFLIEEEDIPESDVVVDPCTCVNCQEKE